MDLITQGVLGAAVGEAVLGHKVGNKAALWGAAGGLLPDLDTLANPFLTDVQELVYHRGITHALVFAAVVGPLLGALLHRRYRDLPASRRHWAWMMFAALVTHPLLDSLTTYGTQLFLPFTNYPAALDTIFVIDPLYTVPFAVALVVALRRPVGSTARRRAIWIGIGWSCFYLLFCFVNKTVATRAFERALAAEGIAYERLATRPTPLNSLLWTATADDGRAVYVGLYSIFDGDASIRFQRIAKNADLLAGLDHPDVRRLRWFSRGYFHVEAEGPDLHFSDLRFGRNDFGLTGDGDYIFHFRIRRAPDDPDRVLGVEHVPPTFAADGATLRRFLARIGGPAAPP